MTDLKEEMAKDVASDIVKKLLQKWAEEGNYGAIVEFMNPGLIKHKEVKNNG